MMMSRNRTINFLVICLLLFSQFTHMDCYADNYLYSAWYKNMRGFISAFEAKDYVRAEQLARSAIKLSESNQDYEADFLLISMQQLMRLYVYKKRYSDAAELSRRIIKITDKYYGKNNIESINSLAEHANIFMLKGDLEQAIKFNKSVYKLRREILGDEHIDTLVTINNLVLLTSKVDNEESSDEYSVLLIQAFKKKLTRKPAIKLSTGLSPRQLFDENFEHTTEQTEKILMTTGIEEKYPKISIKLKQKEMQSSFRTGNPMSLNDWTLSFAKEQNKNNIARLTHIERHKLYFTRSDFMSNSSWATSMITETENPPQEKVYNLLRYPTIEAPETVAVEQDIMVMVSLSETLISPDVNIGSVNEDIARKTSDGALDLSFPEQEEWQIDVVLNASGFTIADGNIRSIVLKKQGDSTIALFKLHAKEIPANEFLSKIYVSYIYKGQFISRVSKEITIINSNTNNNNIMGSFDADVDKKNKQEDKGKTIQINDVMQTADLTVLVRELVNADQSHSTIVTIISPYLQPMSKEYKSVPRLSDWINSKYAKFSLNIPRGVALENEQEISAANKDRAIPLMKGFGKELYKKFAPDIFKQAYWKLVDKKKKGFDTIQVYTNNPVLPWELMKPIRTDNSEEHDFIGINYNIARWHVTENSHIEEKPPLSLEINKLFVIAPDNQNQASLPWQQKEIDNLSHLQHYEKISANYKAVKYFFQTRPDGIVHFAGHGSVKKGFNDIYEYSLYLDNQELDLDTWKGIIAARSDTHPLYFINSCIVGQSHRIANMVDGWAPAMLESGASGYIGALWPVGDRGASRFSIQFYQYINEDLKHHSANVAEAIKKTRKLFYETGDPTFLSYIFYGDPNFNITMH